jgi:hypothetical protein
MTAQRRIATTARLGAALLLGASLMVLPVPSQAGLVGVLMKAAGVGKTGKAAAGAGKTAAGGAAAAGATDGAGLLGRGSAYSADEISKASGLGKAVPDEVAAMRRASGKTLADVPDAGARAWLSQTSFVRADADAMVRDYALLLEGKPALGPVAAAKQSAPAKNAPATAALPPSQGARAAADAQPSWFALELLIHAAHLGHRGAQTEQWRVCQAAAAQNSASAASADLRAICAYEKTASASAAAAKISAPAVPSRR